MLNKLLRVGEGRMVKRLDAIASHVEALEDEIASLSDDDLQAKTDEFKDRIAKGETLDELLPEAFAATENSGLMQFISRRVTTQILSVDLAPLAAGA